MDQMSALSAQRVATMPASRRLLCVVYAAIAVVALIGVWSQLGPYLNGLSAFFVSFWRDAKVTPSSRSITADILLFGLSAAILMVVEARKHNVRFVWAYIVAAFLVAVSVSFPLFLIARELRMNASEAPGLRSTDTILLMLLAVGTLGLTIWVDTA
jgi:hypothetical protein